ncbi:MAG: prepilin-type N-terminal cleavage/methylation domain-containing protein [Candidatus Eremiobacterota bacterium]
MKVRAFSLIEIMIVIAVVVVMIGISTGALSLYGVLQREKDYRHALADARHQLRWLRAQPFRALPPEVLTVDSRRTVRPSQRNLVRVQALLHGRKVDCRRLADG